MVIFFIILSLLFFIFLDIFLHFKILFKSGSSTTVNYYKTTETGVAENLTTPQGALVSDLIVPNKTILLSVTMQRSSASTITQIYGFVTVYDEEITFSVE